MPDQQAPVNFGNRLTRTAMFGPRYFDRLGRGFEVLMEGMMNVAIRQIELTQSLFIEGCTDLYLLTRANTPAAVIAAEVEIMRRRSQRLTNAAQTMAQDLNQSWIATLSCIQPDAASAPARPQGSGTPVSWSSKGRSNVATLERSGRITPRPLLVHP